MIAKNKQRSEKLADKEQEVLAGRIHDYQYWWKADHVYY